MKKLIPVLCVFGSISAFAQTVPNLNLEAKCGYALDGATTTATYHAVPLSNNGANSFVFPMEFSWDHGAKVLVSLNKVSTTCGDGDCKTSSAINYDLTIVRYESEFGKWESFLSKKKTTVKGTTAVAEELSLNLTTGAVSSLALSNGEAVRSNSIPDMSIEYSVKRDKLFEAREKINFHCSFARVGAAQ